MARLNSTRPARARKHHVVKEFKHKHSKLTTDKYSKFSKDRVKTIASMNPGEKRNPLTNNSFMEGGLQNQTIHSDINHLNQDFQHGLLQDSDSDSESEEEKNEDNLLIPRPGPIKKKTE